MISLMHRLKERVTDDDRQQIEDLLERVDTLRPIPYYDPSNDSCRLVQSRVLDGKVVRLMEMLLFPGRQAMTLICLYYNHHQDQQLKQPYHNHYLTIPSQGQKTTHHGTLR